MIVIMNIIYKNKLEDFINFQRSGSKEERQRVKIVTYIIPIIFFPIAIYFLKNAFTLKILIEKRIMLHRGLLYILIGTMWIILYPKIYYWNLKRQLSSLYNKDTKICLEINTDGIIDYKEKSCCKILWEAVDKVELTSKYLHLFISNSSVYIIPLSAIEKPDELEELLSNVSKDKDINFKKIC